MTDTFIPGTWADLRPTHRVVSDAVTQAKEALDEAIAVHEFAVDVYDANQDDVAMANMKAAAILLTLAQDRLIAARRAANGVTAEEAERIDIEMLKED